MNQPNQKRAFTLVEIMIVVLIIGILLAIAVPNWMHCRTASRTQAVLENLREINQAKEHYAMDRGIPEGGPVNDGADLAPTYIKEWPAGPVLGTYIANSIGVDPTFEGQTSDWYVLHCVGNPDNSCPF